MRDKRITHTVIPHYKERHAEEKSAAVTLIKEAINSLSRPWSFQSVKLSCISRYNGGLARAWRFECTVRLHNCKISREKE